MLSAKERGYIDEGRTQGDKATKDKTKADNIFKQLSNSNATMQLIYVGCCFVRVLTLLMLSTASSTFFPVPTRFLLLLLRRRR